MIGGDEQRQRAVTNTRRRSPIAKKFRAIILQNGVQKALSKSYVPEKHNTKPSTIQRETQEETDQRSTKLSTIQRDSSTIMVNQTRQQNNTIVNDVTSQTSFKGEEVNKISIDRKSIPKNTRHQATFSDESSRKESGTAHITNKALDNMRYEGLRLPYVTNEQHASYDNGRIMNKGSSGIRSFWESHVSRGQSEKKEKERQSSMKPYSFPRWRSTDALSASLVASKNVEVPTDSIIPEQRLQKMRESERIAQINKKYIHQQAELTRPMRKGKSLDSLVVQMNENPWYDRKKIRESICIQSIGNTAETRKRFESSKLEESSIHEKLENTSTQSPQRTYSNEEQLFMLYMKQNPQIISNLGVTCSWSTAQAMNELQNQRVELRLLDDNSSISSSSLRQSRYVKKSHIPAPGQLKQTKSEKQLFIGNFPTNQHPNMDKRIDSMIESEIKQLRRREEELLEFRRELGLPTLQEIMYNWKQGPEEKTIHSATSYGHPHETWSAADVYRFQR